MLALPRSHLHCSELIQCTACTRFASGISTGILYLPALRQAASGQDKRALSSLRSRRDVLLARSCGADLEDHQSVFRSLWRVHRSRSLPIPAEFRTPVSHEIVLSVTTSAWLHNVPELSLFTLLSFHCLLRPADARQLQSCDVEFF